MRTYHIAIFLVCLFSFTGCVWTDVDVDADVDIDVGTEAAEEAIESVDDAVDEVVYTGSATEVIEKIGESIEASDSPEDVPFNIDCYGLGMLAGGPRKVSIGYEDCDDKGATLSASRVAYLAKLFVDVWEERGYPEVEGVREHLSRFMIYAVHTEDGVARSPELARIKYPDLYSEDPATAIEQMGDGDAFCFPNGNPRYIDVTERSNFFIALGSHILAAGWAEIVAHEIAHAALWRAYGDADGDHLRDDIWLGHSDDTVLDAVLDRFWVG